MIHHFWQWCKMMTISDPIKKIPLYSIRWPLWCENSYETVLFSTCKNPLPRIVSIPSGVPKKKKSDTGFRVSAFLHWSSRSIDGSSSDRWSEVIVFQINTLMRANRPESRINRAPWHLCGERDTRPWDSGKQYPGTPGHPPSKLHVTDFLLSPPLLQWCMFLGVFSTKQH